MSKRYDEIMAYLEVTDEMRNRILDNIQKAHGTASNKNLLFFPAVRKYLPIAACFALLLVGVWTLPHNPAPDSSESPILASGSGIADAASIQELSDAVGFDVEEITGLPFEAEQTEYTSYWQEMAQVTYTGEGQTLTYRKSVGEEDNSGDYTDYQNCVDIKVHQISIQLKGNGQRFYLAAWNADGYSYSIRSENGLSEAEFRTIIGSSF